jgi:Flp pilus assembly protein TadG
MRTSFFKRLRQVRSDTRAATAVEFALLISPLMFLILASLQLSIIFFASQVLQSAAITSGRQIMTGAVQTAGYSQTTFPTQVVCPAAPVLLTCGSIMVDVESASSYSSLNTGALTPTYNSSGQVTNTWSYSTGGPGDIVILRLMYNWPIVASPLLPGLANQSNGNRLLVGTSVFKNEPY